MCEYVLEMLLISGGCPHHRHLQVAAAVTMRRGGAQTTRDDVSPTSSQVEAVKQALEEKRREVEATCM